MKLRLNIIRVRARPYQIGLVKPAPPEIGVRKVGSLCNRLGKILNKSAKQQVSESNLV
jgi:hypothetical protein